MTPRVSIRFPSSFEHLGLARRVLNSVGDSTPLTDETMTQIGICLIEAAGNSIRHAYKFDSEHAVEIHYDIHPDRLVVEIVDWGQPMPEAAQRLLQDGDELPDGSKIDLQDLPEGGMGFPIMRSVLDELAYESVDGCNTLRLTKLFAPEAATP